MARKPPNPLKPRIGLAAGLMALGLTNAFMFAFLLNWELRSLGRPDIAARGPWLLAFMILPAVGLILGFTLIAILLLSRRSPAAFGGRLWRTALGATIGVLLGVVGANPVTLLLQFVPWSATYWYLLSALVAAILILVLGFEMARRSSPRRRLVNVPSPTA